MIGPDGMEYPVKGVFREIAALERIVTSDEFDEGFEKVVNADLLRGIVMTAVFEIWSADQTHTRLCMKSSRTAGSMKRWGSSQGEPS